MPDAGRTHGPPAAKKSRRQSPQVQPNTGIPRAMVLTLIRALLGAPGFLATVISAMRKHRRQLGISVGMPGPHDFTSA
jgi:hypothetical protein